MRKRVLVSLAVVLAAALILPGTAYAAEPNQGHVVMGGDYTLNSGETLDGDLVIFGGNVNLEAESTVQGSVLLLGGNADIRGSIEGELALVGGNAYLRSTGVVQGNVVSLGGNLQRSDGSEIGGEILAADEFSVPFSFRLPSITRIQGPISIGGFGAAPVWQVLWFLFRSLLLAALAVLVVMFWPNPTERAAKAVVGQPILAGGLGLLTFIVAPILLVVLAITIILSPVSLLAAILLVVAVVFGWIAVGLEVGNRMSEAFGWEVHPAALAGAGTLAMSLVVGGIDLVPCIGWLATVVVAAVGLGAVLLTRFGSREYIGGTAQPAPKSGSKRSSSSKSSKGSSKSSSSEK